MCPTTGDVRCPLCAAVRPPAFFAEARRRYFRCAECDLVFVHPDDRPGRAEETNRYLAHNNSAGDAGYVTFLQRLADPLCARVPIGSQGLDVGCGPSPVLAELLSAGGRPTLYHDPLFFPHGELLEATYDFVTCTEVVEHAHDPAALFAQLVGLLRADGTLAVMTSLLDDRVNFASWWYRRDITHVCFYSEVTMRWIGSRWSLDVVLPTPNVILFADRRGSRTLR